MGLEQRETVCQRNDRLDMKVLRTTKNEQTSQRGRFLAMLLCEGSVT